MEIIISRERSLGRTDETLCPYVVRHLKNNGDKSTEKEGKNKLTLEEFEKIADYFNNKPCLLFIIMIINENLGRPQENLYTKICIVY